MQNNKNKSAFLRIFVQASFLALLPFLAEAQLSCTNSIGGQWNFGTAPRSCNVSPLASTNQIRDQYTSIFFKDEQPTDQGRQEYISSMFPILRDVGRYYIQRRNPSVTQIEMNYFVEGLFTLAHQESFWTHYRNGTDGIIRYMRGDNYHGHGMMQVDDRSHVDALKKGKGVDLIYNMMYGLDIFYAAWVRSASASCVNSASDYKNRARAAWSAYNGGPGSICRWKTKNTAGDQQFLAKYNSKTWLKLVGDIKAPSSLNIKCLAEGVRPCLPGGSPKPTEPPANPNIPYQVGDIVQVVALYGINFRDLLDGKIITRVPKGAQVRVDQLKIQKEDSEVYVKTNFQGVDGYLYGGHLLPQKTFHQWMTPIVLKQGPNLTLNSKRQYGFLRDCPDYSCQKRVPLIRSFGSAPSLQIVKRQSSWIFVKSPELEAEGWIADSEVEEVW